MKWKRKTDSLQPLSGISERNNASQREERSRNVNGARAGKRQSSVEPPCGEVVPAGRRALKRERQKEEEVVVTAVCGGTAGDDS